MAPTDVNPADTIYNYIPSRNVAIAFVILFSVSTILHLGQSIRARIWWLLPTVVLAGVTEIIGWSGRLWSSQNPLSDAAFQMQICCTIMGPTPLIAASFLILGRIIRRLGNQYSRLSARTYSILFVSGDIIALVIQAIGGATASAANDLSGANRGGSIMLGGIAFQLAILSIYVILAFEFFVRYLTNSPVTDWFQLKRSKVAESVDEKGSESQSSSSSVAKSAFRGVLTKKLKIMIVGLALEAVFLYIRAVYRTIELSDGWNGKIIATEWLFNVFDGAMIVLAMYTLNVFHPMWFLYEDVPKQSNSTAEVA